MIKSNYTIGIYGLASQSGRAYFADYLSKGYTVIGYNRPSSHGVAVIDAIKTQNGLRLERPDNSNHESSCFLQLKDDDCVTTDLHYLINRCDVIIIALPSIYHETAVSYMKDAGLQNRRIPIILSPSRSFASPYLWKVLGNGYPIVCFSTCPYSCKAPGNAISLIKRRKRTWVASIEGEFSKDQIEMLHKIFPQAAFTDIPALTSLNNIGAVFHCATYLLNKQEIDRRQSNGEIFSFYMDGIAKRPEVGKILEEIDQVRLEIANKLGLSVFGLRRNTRDDVWRKLINGLRALESENEDDIDILRNIRRLFLEYLNNCVISAQHWLDITYGVERIEGESLAKAISRTPTYQKNSVPQERYITEDIPTGLVVFEALANRFDIECNAISLIIDKYISLYRTDIRKEGRNLSIFTTEEIVDYLIKKLEC